MRLREWGPREWGQGLCERPQRAQNPPCWRPDLKLPASELRERNTLFISHRVCSAVTAADALRLSLPYLGAVVALQLPHRVTVALSAGRVPLPLFTLEGPECRRCVLAMPPTEHSTVRVRLSTGLQASLGRTRGTALPADSYYLEPCRAGGTETQAPPRPPVIPACSFHRAHAWGWLKLAGPCLESSCWVVLQGSNPTNNSDPSRNPGTLSGPGLP